MADLIFPSNSVLCYNQKRTHFTHNKENNILNIFGVLMFQQLLANKHHRLLDSKSWSWFGWVEVWVCSPTKLEKNLCRATTSIGLWLNYVFPLPTLKLLSKKGSVLDFVLRFQHKKTSNWEQRKLSIWGSFMYHLLLSCQQWTLDEVVQVWALVGLTVLCSWERPLCLQMDTGELNGDGNPVMD